MANPHKGEVALECEGRTLTLLFDINAWAELEDLLDLSAVEIVSLMQGVIRLKLLKAVIWAACREYHPEITLKDAGNIIQAVTKPIAEAKITEAIQRSFPQPAEDANAPEGPLTTAVGDGQASSSSGANSGSAPRKRSGGKRPAS